MADTKFSQFANGGDVENTDTVVGLRAGANTKMSMAQVAKGPASSTDGNLAVFDGATGVLLKDGGPVPEGGMICVVVDAGYQLVANNTRYIVSDAAAGKVCFQTPAAMAVGFYFEIWGAGGSPISNWNLSTQVNQSLINGTDITNVGPDRYAILEPSSPTDRASFQCTKEDQDITVGWISSAGLSVYEQTAVDRSLYSRTAATPLALYAMGQVDSAYTGYLLQVQRSSDSATAYVSPDLTFRASPLSALDIGGNLAAWMYGTNVSILNTMDQSGNGVNAPGGALWIQSNGEVASMASTNNTAMYFAGTEAMTGTLASNYTGTELNVFALSQITQADDSSVMTLYNPANGDDYASPLNSIAFHTPPGANMDTYRNATLSVKALPVAINTRMVLASRFTGANNTLTINGVAGTTVASSGVFGFNKILLGARYVSGQASDHGYFKTACVFVYPSMSAGDYADIQTWIGANL